VATIPNPEPDYGPVDSPQPTVPPSELPPMPDDVDMPEPVSEPGFEGGAPQVQA
jgi:hypothetical protein